MNIHFFFRKIILYELIETRLLDYKYTHITKLLQSTFFYILKLKSTINKFLDQN